jgi:hypothetical protein
MHTYILIVYCADGVGDYKKDGYIEGNDSEYRAISSMFQMYVTD